MKRLAAILLAGLSLAPAAAPAAPPIIVGRNGQVIVRLNNGKWAGAFAGQPADGESTEPDLPGAAGKLRWRNGETLPGELVGASPESVSLQTPLFEEPLVLGWSALRRFTRSFDEPEPVDPFAFVLRDGSHVYGRLVALTADTVAIRSTRHGDARLRRAEVLSMRRLRGGDLLMGGPEGDVGWDFFGKRRGESGFESQGTAISSVVDGTVTGPGGALQLPNWNTGVFHEVALPDRVDLEFRVRASRRPDFLVALETSPRHDVRIETWDDELVLADGDRFQSLGKLAEPERTVALRLCWDRHAGRLAVYSPAGEPLAELKWPDAAHERGEQENFRPAIILQNKGRDLALEFMRLRAWDGVPPARLDPRAVALELGDGRMIPGEILDGSANAVRLRLGGADAVASFPLEEVNALVFSPDSPVPPADAAMTLTWNDGTYLAGAVTNIAAGQATVKTAFSDAPLSARMDGLELLLRPPGGKDDAQEPPADGLDKITLGEKTLHGTLVCQGDDQPHWLPVGGVRPAVPARRFPYQIDRAHAAATEGPLAPALFYTSAGDILPGDLRSLDDSGVDFDSRYVEAKRFRPGDLDAVQFNANVPARIEGFTGPGWQIVRGDAARIERKDDGSLKLEAGTALGHPWALEGSEVRFLLVNKETASLRLRLFCADTDGSKAANLAFMRNGPVLYYGLESTEGQMESQQSTSVANKEPVPIRLVITDPQVELYVGDKLVETFPLPLARRAGSGLVIEPAGLWGNQVRPVELSGFAADFEPGHVGMPTVNAEAKNQALTVPRFRKDDPPRQALIAVNGDVLRGKLTGATASQFAFRSGLEALRVPRDRVRAAVWLKPPARDVPAEGKPAVAERLEKRCMLNGQYANMRLRDYVGMILQWDPELKARYAGQLGNRRLRMRFEQPTIGEALDQVCATFELAYRLEGDTVVFSAVGVPPPDMQQQIYWLAPDFFPGRDSAQEVLASKGLSFPEGAYARWEPEKRQIVMTNTPENQRKLADLLRAESGGTLSAPTHWLMLTDGTRLGLAVDGFDPAAIVGHHPVYGRCEVPLSTVSAIRSTAPEPNAAGRTFAEWRLVAAPEPVLPGAGGEGNALAGKEPKSFTLPLLGGGEFNLAREKGKVVVLDFWATWCPPCIQSLPGLIEAMDAFPADQVRFVGVDQAESAAQVQRFLSARGWKLAVALDASQEVGQQFGAESIPQTVVIGPDGKVARVWTGYQPGEETEIADTVRKLLVDPPKRTEKNDLAPQARRSSDTARTVPSE